MKHSLLLFLAIGLSVNLAQAKRTEQLQDQKTLTDTLCFVNQHWQQSHAPQATAFWHNAAYHTGNIALYRLTLRNDMLNYSKIWAEYNHWQGATEQDSALWQYKTYGEDNQHVLFADWQICFQTYIDLYRICGTKEQKQQWLGRTTQVLEYILNHPQSDYWWWIDALYMGMPQMMQLYSLTQDARYLDKMQDCFRFTDSLLYDPEEHLYYRDARYIYPIHQTDNNQKDFWARGNGWAIAAFAKVLQDLPHDHPLYPTLHSRFTQMAYTLRTLQQPEGYWTRSLTDSRFAPGAETSGTAFFLYAITWGVNQQLLPEEDFRNTINCGFRYLLHTALQKDGTVGYVQPIGDRAIPGQTLNPNSTADFGVGAFLLAGTEYVRYHSHDTVQILLYPDQAEQRIPKEIYGQFAEHLGSCIYGGIWVGKNSDIPNTNGYRNDVLQALQNLHIPVMRWPGGCFADAYHWKDGIGNPDLRPKIVNTYWGGTTEDNSFGTHEFLNLCELLGCEPYISANVGSGTVQEMADWVEYMTSNEQTPLTELRKQNGRDKAWNVKYIGIGNESWGCGGQMTPEYYSDLYRRYAEFARNYSGNRLYKIASGASDYDYYWTETLMQHIGKRMNAISLHYYTVKTWDGDKGSATLFSDSDYYWTLAKCRGIEPVIKRHCDIMDKYDPQRKIKLFIDEWGTWWAQEPNTIDGHLYQQNTMRDAMVAALSLNIFHNYTNRIGMTNIAQVVNVLQAMIMTHNDSMLLTPTYHVFRMYQPHQEALHIPLTTQNNHLLANANGVLAEVPVIDATASMQSNGNIVISISNTHLNNAQTVCLRLGKNISQIINAEILHAAYPQAHNTFANPGNIQPRTYTNYSTHDDCLVLQLPPLSIVTLTAVCPDTKDKE